MVNVSRYYRALESVSIASALSTAFNRSYHTIPIPDPSPSNADSLKLQLSYSSEEGVVAGHSKQFTPGGYLSTVTYTTRYQ